jgi:hypothetical protein
VSVSLSSSSLGFRVSTTTCSDLRRMVVAFATRSLASFSRWTARLRAATCVRVGSMASPVHAAEATRGRGDGVPASRLPE